MSVLAVLACSDTMVEEQEHNALPDKGRGTGEMVFFSSGTTENTVTRADAKSYYMPNDYRFVCRMYYKAQTGSEEFDVSGNTDQTAWLKVSGNVGNSLYWNKHYAPVAGTVGPGGVDDFGNDYSATTFYWQNRKEHAFLAWTDLNHATRIEGGDGVGRLNFEEDTMYRVYSNEKVKEYELDYYEIYGIPDKKFTNQEAMEEYVKTNGKDPSFTSAQSTLETEKNWAWSADQYHYRHGKQYKWSREHISEENPLPDVSYDMRWYQEFMYFETIPYTPDETETQEMSTEPGKQGIVAYLRKNGIRVAKATLKADNTSYDYAKTDEYGNLIYNEEKPEFTFYFSEHRVMKERLKYDEYPCNSFDLTRGTKTSMAMQPDIVQALEKQAPTLATQESNRVNLYFKHQFSQVQVNVKNAADNSVALTSADILKVELLGVSDEGYVFTELDKEGKVHPAAYKEIDFSKYTEQHLKDNQFGTSFDMFTMPEAATGYLKSFDCITFGQLQAIRITWQESDGEHYQHASTFRIPNTELMNLQSGVKYVWNIEVRRGTLAIIRTEIVDWDLPTDLQHNGSTDGTIHN